jgi:4a-hydroxytetrahydrobiopterin dehydratase
VSGLADRHCVRVKKGSPPLAPEAAARLGSEVPSWEIRGGKTVARTFKFPDFKSALAFTDRVGALADAEDHHPDIHLSWGRVAVELTTHSAGGLTDNDFILAAKIDRLASGA